MIFEALTSLTEGLNYAKRHPQLMMTVLLVILIPTAFIISGQQFLEAGRENQDRLEKDRIGILHDVFASYLVAIDFENELIISQINKISSLNEDITAFVIAKEEGSSVRIVASKNEVEIDTKVAEPMRYRISNVNPDQSLILPYAKNGIRYWESYRLVKSNEGETYYIFTRTSLSHIDALFANRIVNAYYWLAAIMIVVMYLVIRHVRLIDYAYLYQETKKANEMKDLFTNMIAHELRAPLTAMRGYASMIRQDTGVTDAIATYATKIEDSSERLVVIVSDLLDVARIQSGRLAIVKESTDVHAVVISVIDAMMPNAEQKNIVLTHEPATSPVSIQADGKRLHQALTNLVSNAIKYTPAGSIVIQVSNIGKMVEIRVKDTGMGISADNQKDLFAPFFRVKSDEVEHITGTGLGMWITKQLIEIMGGSIGVESIKGVGTHIVITLPK